MARYNTSLASATITGATTISSPIQGAFTALTGSAPYTVTLPAPTLFPGTNQTFYNATGGIITLSTPSGAFNGTGASGTSSNSIFAGNVLSVTSDGTNYIVISEDGSAMTATTGNFSSNLIVGGTLTVQSSGGVSMAPSSAGSIDNVAIGASARSSGAFTTVAANGQVSLTANTASSSTSTGTLVVTGGIGVTGSLYAGGTVSATNLTATNVTGTLQTASQPNITSTGGLTVPTVIIGPGTGIGVIRRSTVNGSNGVRVQGNAADGYPTDANAGAYIQVGGGIIGDTFEGNIDIVAFGGNVDGNRNQIRFSNRSGTDTITERMRINKDGNVGIGNLTPAAPLSFADTTGAKIRFYDTPTDKYGIEVQSSELRIYSGAQGASSGGITLGKYDGTTFTEAVRIRNDGDVVVANSKRLNASSLFINRNATAVSGISWYSPSFTSWAQYMSPPGTTNAGPTANITAPSGTIVTSWAHRNFIENVGGYGWTFESGTAQTGTPSVVAEIRASDGSARFNGYLSLPNQPVFYAYYGSIMSTAAVMVFGQTRINVGSCYNTSNGRFTAPIAGNYMFHGKVLHRSSSNQGQAEWTFYKNGANINNRGITYNVNSSVSAHSTMTANTIIPLAAGDYVQMAAYYITASTDFYLPEDLSSFSGYLLG